MKDHMVKFCIKVKNNKGELLDTVGRLKLV